jgi:hypothetical protein
VGIFFTVLIESVYTVIVEYNFKGVIGVLTFKNPDPIKQGTPDNGFRPL